MFVVLIFLLPTGVLSLLFCSLVSIFLFGNLLMKKASIHPRKKINFSYFSIYMFLASAFSVISERLPVLIYESRFGLEVLGVYGGAILVYHTILFIFIEINSFLQTRLGLWMKRGAKFRKVLFTISIILLVVFLFGGEGIRWGIWSLYGEEYEGVGRLSMLFGLAVPAAVLVIYPRNKSMYAFPKLHVGCFAVRALMMIVGALLAKDIFQAVLFQVVAIWLIALVWWGVWWFSRKKIEAPVKAVL